MISISTCPARQQRVSLTWELRVWVARHVGSNDEDPNGPTVGVKRRRDIVIRLGDQHICLFGLSIQLRSTGTSAIESIDVRSTRYIVVSAKTEAEAKYEYIEHTF